MERKTITMTFTFPSYVNEDGLKEALSETVRDITKQAEHMMFKEAECIAHRMGIPSYTFPLYDAARAGHIKFVDGE